MATKHEKDVLAKLVNDPHFSMKDAQESLDMDSRSGAANKVKNVAIEVLQDLKWPVENPVAKGSK